MEQKILYKPENDKELLKNVMNLFMCDQSLAKTIIISSKLNGRIEQIKDMCRNNNT